MKLCLTLLVLPAVLSLCCAADQAQDKAAPGPAASPAAAAVAKPAPTAKGEAAKPQEKTVETAPDGCATEQFSIPSPSMKRDIKVVVVLPPEYATKAEARYPVLYALHGMGAPYATWSEMGPLRKTLRERPMVVVCFDGDRAGWYIDATKKSDSKFVTFMFDELIPHMEKNYRTNGLRGVTGFSMGGYGAFHYMLTRPEAFVAVSSLSGAFSQLGEKTAKPNGSLAALLGPFEESKADYLKCGIYNRLEACVQTGVRLPPMFLACGTEDGLLDDNHAFVAFLMEQNKKLKERKADWVLTFRYEESPGAHKWAYWRDASAAVADFHWRAFQAALAAKPSPPDKK